MTKIEALQMCLEYIETDKHERKYVRHAIKAALKQAEPVACRFCHSEKGCWAWQCYKCGEIDDVQQPAAKPVQEPVSWMSSDRAWMWSDYSKAIAAVANIPTLTLIPLYAAPPQRPWVGLTEDEKFEIAAAQYGWEDLLIAAEAKLKERNT